MKGVIQDSDSIVSGSLPETTPPPEAAILIRDYCTAEFVAGLVADPGLGAFSHYSSRAAERQRGALAKVARLPGSRVLVAHRGECVVAYLTFHPPEADSRWAGLPAGEILELGGIEVARGLRGRKLARRLMDRAFSSPDFDAMVVYAQALTWCWDLEGSNMSQADYRQMMLRLFGAYGFEPYATDEPNIRYDRANLLLARVGPRASRTLLREFWATLIENRGEW